MIGAVHIQFDRSLKNPIVRIYRYGSHVDLELIGYHFGEVIDQSYPIHSHYPQTGQESNFLLAGPPGLDHPVAMIRQEFKGIGTGGSMDLDSFIDSNKTKNIVSRYRVTASGEDIIDHIHILPVE